MNKVTLIGRIGKEPETKRFDNGQVTNVSIATTERYTKDGEKKEITDWHNLSFNGKLSEIAEKYITKGSHIAIIGKLRTRSWETNGEKKYITEIIVNEIEFLGGNKNAESESQSTGNDYDDLPY